MLPASKPKLTTIAILFALVLFAGCKKDKSPSSDNFWAFNGVKYFVIAASRTALNLSDPPNEILFQNPSNLDGGDLQVGFKTMPTSSGTYKLREYIGEPLKDGEMSLGAVTNSVQGSYTGPGVNIQVTVTNGKIKIVIP